MHQTVDEEKRLLEKFGKRNPFRTPENYFDTLPDIIMQRIDSRRKRRKVVWRRAIAAILAGCVATAGFMMMREHKNALEANSSDQYMEEALEYSMIDNNEIAFYLTEAE